MTALELQASLVWPQIQQSEKNDIINVVNKLRNDVRPARAVHADVTWDYNLENKIKTLLPYNRTTLFDFNLKYPPPFDIRANMNLMHLTKSSSFNGTYNYVFHDTCNDKAGDVKFIFKYRANQLHCMDYKKCNSTAYNSFLTCVDKPIPRLGSIPCSWAWRYVTPLVADNLKTIACVRFSHPGPYTPNKQKDSFGCYGKYHDPISDVPYAPKLKSKL